MFPFDFVCKSIAPAATCTPRLFLGNLSPVSYSAVLFGIYFAMREPLSAGKQGEWSQPIAAVSAGALAVIAGAPFDKVVVVVCVYMDLISLILIIAYLCAGQARLVRRMSSDADGCELYVRAVCCDDTHDLRPCFDSANPSA